VFVFITVLIQPLALRHSKLGDTWIVYFLQ
jgi:hypothetical protein